MLTKRQKEVLDFIKSYSKKKGYAPSLEEIQKQLKFASVSTAHFHVARLKVNGYLDKMENKARGITINDEQLLVRIPLLGTIAAGEPIEAIQEKEMIAIPKSKVPNGGDIYALRVSGNSMIEEEINDGDVVVVRNQPTAENGQKIVALIDDNGATLKKYYREKGRVRLQPANSDLQPKFIHPSQLTIQGIVVDVIKRLEEEEVPILTLKNVEEKKSIKSDLPLNKIVCSDCITGLKDIPENSIDGCITDPPYNYEFVGHKWDVEEIKRRTERVKNSKTLIKHIPYGSGLAGGVRNERWYQKNAENINDYQNWCYEWGKEIFRVSKPGAYVLVFNSSRTIAHVQVALEKAGFYARDVIVWRKNSGIPKGLNFVKKLEKEGISDSKKWEGWHSCPRNEWEAIVLLQKPLVNNYLETVKEFGIGLLHTQNGNGFQSNIFENIKRDKKESFNIHSTIKPIELITKLIDLTIPSGKNKVVLDPFMGSGTTAIAAIEKNISYLGFEINKDYCDIANKRISSLLKEKGLKLF